MDEIPCNLHSSPEKQLTIMSIVIFKLFLLTILRIKKLYFRNQGKSRAHSDLSVPIKILPVSADHHKAQIEPRWGLLQHRMTWNLECNNNRDLKAYATEKTKREGPRSQ